jgi:hypothetical protein
MLRKVSDMGTAQDLAQETFLISFENLARLKDHATGRKDDFRGTLSANYP